MKEWKMVLKSSNLCFSLVQWGFGVHVLAPEWVADKFPSLREWLTFGASTKDVRVRKMTPQEEREGLQA